jgi:hypothetical protein
LLYRLRGDNADAGKNGEQCAEQVEQTSAVASYGRSPHGRT